MGVRYRAMPGNLLKLSLVGCTVPHGMLTLLNGLPVLLSLELDAVGRHCGRY